MPFIFPSNCSNKNLQYNVEIMKTDIFVLFLCLEGKYSVLLHLSMRPVVGFPIFIIRLWRFLSIPSLLSVFNKGQEILWNALVVPIQMIMWILSFILTDTVYYSKWFSNQHSMSGVTALVMIYSPLYKLLDLVYSILLRILMSIFISDTDFSFLFPVMSLVFLSG